MQTRELDNKVDFIFNESATNYINGDTNVETFFNSTEFKINNSINHDLKVLAEYIRENRKPWWIFDL